MTFGMDIFKTADAAEFADFQKKMADVKVKVVKVEGDKAELEVTMGGETKPAKMTKVEGRWIPSELADDWKKNMAEAKADIEKSMGEMAADKPKTMAQMNQVLDALTKAEAGDMAGMQGLMGMLGAM
jgi:hypothetical protein